MRTKSFNDYIKVDEDRVDVKRYECLHDDMDYLIVQCKKCGKLNGKEFKAIKLPKYIRELIVSHIRTLAS